MLLQSWLKAYFPFTRYDPPPRPVRNVSSYGAWLACFPLKDMSVTSCCRVSGVVIDLNANGITLRSTNEAMIMIRIEMRVYSAHRSVREKIFFTKDKDGQHLSSL